MAQTYWGEQTNKALANFGQDRPEPDFIRALAEVKKAALLAIQEHETRFEKNVITVLLNVLDEIIAGSHDDQFPLPLKQGSAGTSLNMNMNEVIAGLTAARLQAETGQRMVIDPIEDINRFQSTNDVVPTAITVMAYRQLSELEKLVIALQEALINREHQYEELLITGRTELQTALPITLGQVFGGWAGCIERDRWRLFKLKERIRSIALGGTALGTCFSAPAGYIFAAERYLREITGLPLCRSQNLVDEISNQDKLAELAGGYSLCAQNLVKISQDLLLYTSSLAGELEHPELQSGSTIMAAKHNPVTLELVKGLALNVQGEAFKVNLYMQQGQLQLNAFVPFIIPCLITMYRDLARALCALKDQFLANMGVCADKIEKNLVGSFALLNALLPLLGYHRSKELYRKLQAQPCAGLQEFKDFIIQQTNISREELDAWLHPLLLTSTWS
jgi:aspartate ammonia-lyase